MRNFLPAAEAMRRILVDPARRKHALKRGGGAERISLDRVDLAADTDEGNLFGVNDALEKLAAKDAPSQKFYRAALR